MRYFLSSDGIVHAIGESSDTDGDQSELILPDWTEMTKTQVDLHLDLLGKAKAIKMSELDTAFVSSVKAPVKVGTKYYNGGKESAQAIRDYIQLITESGGSTYTIWDSSNNIASYTLAEATAIKLAVASSVASAEFNLRLKKNDVASAATIEAVNSVVL